MKSLVCLLLFWLSGVYVFAQGPELVAEAGLFKLRFNDSHSLKGFFDPEEGLARRNCLIQVFRDVSALFDMSDVPVGCSGDGGFIEICLKFESIKFIAGYISIGERKGVVGPSLVQEYLQTGVDPLDEGERQDNGHAVIEFNFDYEGHFDADFMNLPEEGKFDLYSVALHEVMHLLGFESLITPKGAVYSYFDTYLVDQDGKSIVTVSADRTSASLTEDLFVDGEEKYNKTTEMYFKTQNKLIPVYMGDVPYSGQAFTHVCADFEDYGYVMSAGLKRGRVKRKLHQDEIDILTAIGYKITGVYGDGNAIVDFETMSGRVEYQNTIEPVDFPYAVDDYLLPCVKEYFSVNAGEPITVNLVENDINAESITNIVEYDYVNVFGGSDENFTNTKFDPVSTSYLSVSDDQKSVTFTPNMIEPDHTRMFGYYALGGDGKRSPEEAFVYFNVKGKSIQNDGDCNFIVNGDFAMHNLDRVNWDIQKRRKGFDTDLFGWKTFSTETYYEPENSIYVTQYEEYAPCVAVGGDGDDGKGVVFGKLEEGLLADELYMFRCEMRGVSLGGVQEYSFNVYLNRDCPQSINHEGELIGRKVLQSPFEISSDLEEFSSYFSLNDEGYDHILFEAESAEERNVVLVRDLVIEPSDKFSVVVAQGSYGADVGEELDASLEIVLDSRCKEQKYDFSISLNLSEGLELVSSNGYFDADGNPLVSINGLKRDNNTISIPLVLKGVTEGTKFVDVEYTYHSCSSSKTEHSALFFDVPLESGWIRLMSYGGYATAPSGKVCYIDQIGVKNTQRIVEESFNEQYAGMSDQERTIAAAKKVFGDDCTARISAQNAWFVLGLYDEYVKEEFFKSTVYTVHANESVLLHVEDYISSRFYVYEGGYAELKAGNYIDIKANSELTGDVYAYIVECDDFVLESGIGNSVQDEGDDEKENEGLAFVKLMPNPTTGKVTVYSSDDMTQIALSSSGGAEVLQYTFKGKEFSFDIGDLPDGVYYVEVCTIEKTYVEKLVLRK